VGSITDIVYMLVRNDGCGVGGEEKFSALLLELLVPVCVCVCVCVCVRAYGINGDSGSVSLFDRVENFTHRFAIILDARTPFQ